MTRENEAFWNELGPLVERHQAVLAAQEALSPELLRELEEYSRAGGGPGGLAFHPREAVALMLNDVRQYEAALYELAAMADEQEKLMKHQAVTGGGVTEGDRGRWFALLKVKQKAGEALGLSPKRLEAEVALLAKTQRYEAVLNGIIMQAQNWKRLMDMREETGQGVTETERAVWRACLGNAYDAAMALGLSLEELLNRVSKGEPGPRAG